MSSRLNRSSMEDMLPPNLMFDILSRLPIKSIIYCKSVSKKWLNLISDPYFVHLHLSKSPEALMMHEDLSPEHPGTLNWVQIKHESDNQLLVPVNKLHLQRCPPLLAGYLVFQQGSVNGLICCCQRNDAVYIFNPVFEQYIIIPPPKHNLASISYGFGVSTTGEYKVIRIVVNLHDRVYEIGVYTLGTCEWRLARQKPPYAHCSIQDVDPGVFVNNHVYWLLPDAKIYGFDLDSETFELFPSPPEDNHESRLMLGVLKGGLSRISWFSLGLEVWVMKEGSWYKEIAIQEVIDPIIMWGDDDDESEPVCLIDGLKGTSVLMVHNMITKDVVACCLNTNTILPLNLQGDFSSIVLRYRPSFVRLDNFGSERVHAIHDEGVSPTFEAFKPIFEYSDPEGRQDGIRDDYDCALEKGDIEQDSLCRENEPNDLADAYETSSDQEPEISDEIDDPDDDVDDSDVDDSDDDLDEHDDIDILKLHFGLCSDSGGDQKDDGVVDGSKDADDGERQENVRMRNRLRLFRCHL